MYKTKLQEVCFRHGWKYPDYESTMEGPPHKPMFRTQVTVNGHPFDNHERFKNKKAAENEAARLAFEHFSSPEFAPSPGAANSAKKGLSWIGTTKASKKEFKEIKLPFSDPLLLDLAYLQKYVQPKLPETDVEQENEGNLEEDLILAFVELYKKDN